MLIYEIIIEEFALVQKIKKLLHWLIEIWPTDSLKNLIYWYTEADNFFEKWTSQPISVYTVKPAHAVTSVKQSPVLKGHLFLVLS